MGEKVIQMENDMVDEFVRLYIIRDTIDDTKQIIVFISHCSHTQRKDSNIGNPCRFSDLEKLRSFIKAIGVNAWAKPIDPFPKSEITFCDPDQVVNWLQEDPGKLDQIPIVLLALDVTQEEAEKRFRAWENEDIRETHLFTSSS